MTVSNTGMAQLWMNACGIVAGMLSGGFFQLVERAPWG